MSIKLFDSELKVMNVLWQFGDMRAKDISDILNKDIGWNINTAYTVIKKCIAKGAVSRREPHFVCHPEVTKEEIRQTELSALIDKFFDGASDKLFAALIDRREMSEEEIRKLKDMVNGIK